ncbi:transposase [Rhodovulum sulfidophilum]|nr:transposase [Rhodovulum sulfidophilum]
MPECPVEMGASSRKGLRAAARRVFDATHQRRRTHRMCNTLAFAPARQRGVVAATLKTIYFRETKAEAVSQ